MVRLSWHVNFCISDVPELHAAASASAYHKLILPRAGFTAETLSFVTPHFGHLFKPTTPAIVGFHSTHLACWMVEVWECDAAGASQDRRSGSAAAREAGG